MSQKAIVARVDETLRPRGFSREKLTWTRAVESLVEAVELQVSKSRDLVTLNGGVLENAVYEIMWGKARPRRVEVPHCTVNVRVGRLIGGVDHWWLSDRADTHGAMVGCLTEYVLPFLERMHSLSEMERFLTEAGVTRRRYPPPIINLAILMHRRGDHEGACEMLSTLRRNTIGAWKQRTAEVALRLGCIELKD